MSFSPALQPRPRRYQTPWGRQSRWATGSHQDTTEIPGSSPTRPWPPGSKGPGPCCARLRSLLARLLAEYAWVFARRRTGVSGYHHHSQLQMALSPPVHLCLWRGSHPRPDVRVTPGSVTPSSGTAKQNQGCEKDTAIQINPSAQLLTQNCGSGICFCITFLLSRE